MQPGQSTLGRSFVAMALIAVGCFGLSLWIPESWRGRPYGPLNLVDVICGLTACCWIFAGIGLLAGRWMAGAVLGVLQQVIFLVAAAVLINMLYAASISSVPVPARLFAPV